MSLLDRIERLAPCASACDWLADRPDDPQRAWDECDRPDWMVWLLPRAGADKKQLLLCMCEMGRKVISSFSLRDGETALLEAIEKAVASDGPCEVPNETSHLHRISNQLHRVRYAYVFGSGFLVLYDVVVEFCLLLAVDCAEIEEALCKPDLADVVRKFFPNPPEITP